MSEFQVDLTNCDHEPIHIPGQIQSHGFLIVVDEQTNICFYSDNTGLFIDGITAQLLGRPFQDLELLMGPAYQPGFIGHLLAAGKENKGFERTNPAPVEIGGINYFLIIAKSAAYYLLEFEPALSNFDLDVQSMMGWSIAEILSYRDMQLLMERAAGQVKQIINFDRVMIYRFAADGHGEVVAEARQEALTPWLGLHYPASDIPQQARELYKRSLTRLIADVHATPSMITGDGNNPNPLDLTYSQLRAVSPIHIQYLKNMGVASSFSISLKYKDELWGLIACHNYSPRFIDFKSREYAKLIGQILSSALEFRQDEETQHTLNGYKLKLDKLARQLQENELLEDALTTCAVNILEVVNAGGAILAYNKKIYKLGVTPTDEQLIELLRWINDNNKEAIFETTSLMALYPEAAAYKDVASGMMIAIISKELGDYMIWFKPEQVRTVKWAGNPEKPVEITANGLLQISPRNSFEIWEETVSGKSVAWNASEISSVNRLKEEINYGLNLKAGAMRMMNERLRQAYEELETFSYTISHDLKNPLASIKSYAQLLIRDNSVLERGQKLLQRIADRADQMNLMINAVLDYSRIGRSGLVYRTINTGNLVADIIMDMQLVYDMKNVQITVSEMPEMRGDPIMILQVFSNLLSNAVKYSMHISPAIIHVEGLRDKQNVTYSIRDNGLGIAETDLPKIFELFNRMENVKDIEGSGVGLAIVKRIVEKHNGHITAKSELNKGSVFLLNFNQ